MSVKVVILTLFILLLLSAALHARSPWLGQDKTMHFLTSAYLTYWNYGLSRDIMGQSVNSSLLFSISLTTFLGLSKEYSDKKLGSTGWSWYDLAYNGTGILFGIYLTQNLR